MKLIKKVSIIVVIALMIFFSGTVCKASSYDLNYRYWSQGQSEHYWMRQAGCWIVAQAKLLYASGIERNTWFNPDTYAQWEAACGYIRSFPDELDQINGGQAPSTYASQKGLTLEYLGEWGADANQLWYNINAGYYTIVKVNGGGHYTLLDNEKSKETGILYCDDSSIDNYYRGPRKLSEYGTWTSGYVYRGGHVHKYSSSITKAATCTSAGEKTFKCGCGASYTEAIPASGHKYNTVTTKNATCVEDGENKSTCSVCKNEKIDKIAALGHKYIETVIEPTIDNKGYTLHKCSVCGDNYKDNYKDEFKVKEDGWYYADKLPSFVDNENYMIEYNNYAEKVDTKSPGTDWKLDGVSKVEWRNVGDPYVSDHDEQTSDALVLVSKIFFHFCGSNGGSAAFYGMTDKYVHWDGISGNDVTYSYWGTIDGKPYYHVYYGGNELYCRSGLTCDGAYGSHSSRANVWYVENKYQRREKITYNKYVKETGWVKEKDSSASKVMYRFRIKSGWVEANGNKYYLDEDGNYKTGWVVIDKNTYYFDKDGVMQKGVVTIKNNTYYFDDNGQFVKGEFITIDGKIYYFGAATGTLQKTGWYTKNGKKYYLDKTTGEVAVGLKTIDSVKYYFNNQGVMQKGKVDVDNVSYYFDEEGKMVKGQFIKVNGILYYFGAQSGTLQKTGWYSKDGKKYYLDKTTGEVAVGLKAIDGNKYYFNEQGVMQKGIITVNGKIYNLNETGVLISGIVVVGGKQYYCDENGNMVKGEFITIDGKIYYFGAATGTLQKTGWYTKNGKKYYLDKTTGEVAVGLKTIDSVKYYFNNQGVMQKGKVDVDNVSYYFDEEGKMVKGQFIKVNGILYYFGAQSGTLQKSGWYLKDGKKYYLDKTTGEVAVGFKVIDGKKYYFNEQGVLQKGTITVNGKTYYLDENGALKVGVVVKDGKEYYYDENGNMVKGKFITIDGKLYYFGAQSGSLQKTGWYSKDGKKYYLDKTTGEVAVGLKTIDSVTYYFNNQGVMQKGKVVVGNATYYFDEAGKMVKGQFITINEKLYYFGAQSGTLQKSGWYSKNGNKYYLDKTTGEVAVGLKEIDGAVYYFDNQGILQPE